MADDKTPEQLKAAAAAAQNLQNELKRVLELKKALSDAKSGGVVANALQEELKIAQAHTVELGKHKDLNEGAAKEALKTAKHDLARAEAAERTSKAREAEAKQYENINKTLGKAKAALSAQLGMWTSIDGIAAHLLESVVQLDGALKGLGKDTGLVGQFDDAMMGAWESSAGLGATMEDARAGMGALASTLPRFTSLSAAQAQAMGAQAIAFEKAGIGAQGFANISNVMMETLGKSAAETINFSNSLVSLSKKIGVSAKKMATDFESVKETVAEFGDNGGEVFKSLAKQGRALGVEINTLVKVAEGFDTFEDAASRVGKLNAQMGLNLNAVAMMNEQDPTKRIQMIRDQFQMTGKSFETMSRLEKKAVAEMMGVDVSIASRMLGTEDEFRQATEGQETAAEMAKNLQTMGDKLTAIGQKILTAFMPVLSLGITIIETVIMPIFDAFISGIGMIKGAWSDTFDWFAKHWAEWSVSLAPVFNIFSGLGKAFSKIGEILSSVDDAFGNLFSGFGKGIIVFVSATAGLVLLAATFMKLKSIVTGAFSSIKSIFGMASETVSDAAPELNKTSTSLGDTLKSLGEGLKEMAGKNVFFGALNLIPAGIGLLFAAPGIALISLVGKIDPTGSGVRGILTGLAAGLTALGMAPVLFGALNLVPAGIGLLLAAPGLAIMSLVGKLDPSGAGVRGILTGLAAGLTVLGNPKVLLGTLAMALMGGAMWIFAKSLQAFASVDFGAVLKGLLTLGALTLAIGTLGAVMMSGIGALVFGAGLAALVSLAVSITTLGLALSTLTSGGGNVLTDIMTMISSFSVSSVYSLAASFGALASSILLLGLSFANPLTLFGMWAFASTMEDLLSPERLAGAATLQTTIDGIQGLVKASVEIDSGSIENLERLVDQVIRVTAEAGGKEDIVDKILQAIGLANSSKEKKSGEQKTIKLMLNERELGEVVTELVKERYDLATT